MERIPYLYDGINFETLPKSIYDELITNSNDRSFTVTKNDKGETITIDGEYLSPLFIDYTEDYNFYLNAKHYEQLEYRLNSGICFDKDYNKITIENIYSYLKHYNDGFIKGYNEFENSLKNNTSLFSVTNKQIAFKIFSRIKQNGLIKENDGSFKFVNDAFSKDQKDIEERICKENNIRIIMKIYEEDLFKSGFNGGEFYKAWEIILNNPTVFEPFFLKNNGTNNEIIETEAIDLSNTTATEKIIYLQKLGVIDFLKNKQPFLSSTNSLATVLSAVTGAKAGTIQSMINPIISTKVDDKNNPLNSQKTVSKVEKQLINIGFNLNETI